MYRIFLLLTAVALVGVGICLCNAHQKADNLQRQIDILEIKNQGLKHSLTDTKKLYKKIWWAKTHTGRSGFTATQFLDLLVWELDKRDMPVIIHRHINQVESEGHPSPNQYRR